MSLKPVIGGTGFYDRPSGGAPPTSVPALPTWTYAGVGPAPGEFITDNAVIAATAALGFSDTAKYGDANWNSLITMMVRGSVVILTDSQGRTSVFQVTGAGISSVTPLASQSGSWSGDYQVTFIPAVSLSNILATAGVTPVSDGTVNPITSLTTQSGIVTGAS